MPYFTNEQIKKARAIDLLTYLQTYEPTELVHLRGNTYCTREHDSLKISNGKWYWWSHRLGGRSALDYLTKVKGLSFTDAMKILAGDDKSLQQNDKTRWENPQEEVDKRLLMLERSDTNDHITGKTRISKQFAEYLEVTDTNGEKNWLIVPVGADWTDNARVLGFYNPLADNGAGRYEKTGILKLIERANNNPEVPYFLILDEMNLSHVERYFSDFLSHMETPDNPFELDGYKNKDDEEESTGILPYPDNLFVIGTVNIGETTYMFSPKVLDRANVIEFKPDKNDVLELFNISGNQVKITPAKSGIAEAFLRLAKDIRSGATFIDDDQMTDVRQIFSVIYEIVEQNGYEFAYRTVREIRQYLNAAYQLSEGWSDLELYRSIDEQLLQKVLPKIHGNRKEIGKMLEDLDLVCKQSGKELNLSSKKIEQMKGKLAAVQYASFI